MTKGKIPELRFDRILLRTDGKTHKVYETFSTSGTKVHAYDGLNELERELFACGADTVGLDGRTYRKIEDHAIKGETDIIRSLTYKLSRLSR